MPVKLAIGVGIGMNTINASSIEFAKIYGRNTKIGDQVAELRATIQLYNA